MIGSALIAAAMPMRRAKRRNGFSPDSARVSGVVNFFEQQKPPGGLRFFAHAKKK
jgi:hypothetical protein